MAPKSTPWFRLYSETLTDRKILRIRSITGLPKCTVIGAWATLLIMANDSPQRGRLLVSSDNPIIAEEIITEWELPPDIGQALIAALTELDLIHLEGRTYVITQWDSRQFTSDRDGAERVKRYRERKQECNNDVTLQNARCNNIVTSPEAESEADTDTEVVAANSQLETKNTASQPAAASEKLLSFYLAYCGNGKHSKGAADIINGMLASYSENDVIYAVDEAIKYGKHNLAYIDSICKRRSAGKPDQKGHGNGTISRLTEEQREALAYRIAHPDA